MPSSKKQKAGKLSIADMRKLINKKAGQSVAHDLQQENPTEVTEWIPTGSRWLNSIICRGKYAGIPVGKISSEVERLLRVTEESMYEGIKRALHKNRVGDVSHAVQSHVESAGFAVITNFVGHGVGHSLHEDPQIPNFGKTGTGPKFKKGMAICIEPMVNMKSSQIRMAADGWTALAVDGMPSAHFEHTLLVDEENAEILTFPDGFENADDFISHRMGLAV